MHRLAQTKKKKKEKKKDGVREHACTYTYLPSCEAQPNVYGYLAARSRAVIPWCRPTIRVGARLHT